MECDASLIDEDGVFGAVGAVAGVCNPIDAAHQIAVEALQPLSLGRVRPL